MPVIVLVEEGKKGRTYPLMMNFLLLRLEDWEQTHPNGGSLVMVQPKQNVDNVDREEVSSLRRTDLGIVHVTRHVWLREDHEPYILNQLQLLLKVDHSLKWLSL